MLILILILILIPILILILILISLRYLNAYTETKRNPWESCSVRYHPLTHLRPSLSGFVVSRA